MELIYIVLFLYDDVIDYFVLRCGNLLVNFEFGNKMVVFVGDFFLGCVLVVFVRLCNVEVVELFVIVIVNLVEGEFMQFKNMECDECKFQWFEEVFSYYLQKMYFKMVSLIFKLCCVVVLLGGVDEVMVEVVYLYGRNFGLVFQFVDDMLDYIQIGLSLGKLVGVDLELGLVIVLLFFVWKNNLELGVFVGWKFEQEGDVVRVSDIF